jgi:DNA-binding transcriptional MerR regulator
LPPKVYRIDEVAVKTGLTKRALRYYENLDLITPLRTESGYRVYSEEDVEKIKRIIEIKDVLGFRLNDIKEILELEKNLEHIFHNPLAEISLIEKSLKMMEKQMLLVEEKKRNLAKVSAEYQKALADLNQLYAGIKERTK